MTFGRQLEEYMKRVGCTAKELSAASGISETTLSRYRNDMRISKMTAEQLRMIAEGLVKLAGDTDKMTYEEVYKKLGDTADIREYDIPLIVNNVNILIQKLDVNSAELAKSLNYDASYLSRIRSGQRKPADVAKFVNGVCAYMVKKYAGDDFLKTIADGSEKSAKAQLYQWICSNREETREEYITDFMEVLDRFDLNEYLSAIHFNETHIPSLPFYLPSNRNYYGTEEMRKGELDFFKCVLFSKKTDGIFMCSDMPIVDMAKDTEFDKKWMMAIAVILKKKYHISIIHDVDRPFHEMLLGLEAWIPLYMTGLVTSYYLKNKTESIYHHLTYIHGNVALVGECISGYPQNGKYYLTRNKEEVSYYKKRADNLLSKAVPLMQVYNEERKEEYRSFQQKDVNVGGTRRNIYSVLPIYTISKELFGQLGRDNGLTEEEISEIWRQIVERKEQLETILTANDVIDEIPDLSAEKDKKPLSLTGIFYRKELFYSAEQYREHFKQTQEYAREHENYTVKIIEESSFRQIDVALHEGKWAMISKKTTPNIHFVIREKKLLHAIEGYQVPVAEE